MLKNLITPGRYDSLFSFGYKLGMVGESHMNKVNPITVEVSLYQTFNRHFLYNLAQTC